MTAEVLAVAMATGDGVLPGGEPQAAYASRHEAPAPCAACAAGTPHLHGLTLWDGGVARF